MLKNSSFILTDFALLVHSDNNFSDAIFVLGPYGHTSEVFGGNYDHWLSKYMIKHSRESLKRYIESGSIRSVYKFEDV